TMLIFLPPHAAVAANFDIEFFRQCVHDRDADTVEPAGDGIPAAAELSSSVQDRQHDLDGRLVLLLVQPDRNSTAVVDDPDTTVAPHGDGDLIAVSRQCF